MIFNKLIEIFQISPILLILYFIFIIFPLLMSIVIHEVSHGLCAYYFGDDTAKKQGRLTLNPLKHLDPIGTIMLFVVGIGWAKPVMINYNNINAKWKYLTIALVGPLSNFILAYLLIQFSYFVQFELIKEAFLLIARINILLCCFNLLPIPPLDGSKILYFLTPEKYDYIYLQIERYALVFLIIIYFMFSFDFLFDFSDKVFRSLL